MKTFLNRRQFLQKTTLGAAAATLGGCATAAPRKLSANDKLNIGLIAVAGRAAGNIAGVKDENIVAICDVDANNLAKAAVQFPKAKQYRDFRRLLEQGDLDAVVISTPDHTHAVATVAALQRGLHVYCEKPLTHTVSEARIVAATARSAGRATQMGNQIHAGANYRRVVELVKSGAIGPVGEAHVWTSAIYGNVTPVESTPPPPQVDYDLWLGPQKVRPYRSQYIPFHWRNFWAFGGGTLADFWCHYADLAHWALDLHQPLSIEAEGRERHAEVVPVHLTVRYKYPANPGRPAVDLTWYQGGGKPDLLTKILPADQVAKWNSGVLFVGTKGQILSNYGQHLLLPEKDFAGFTRPKAIIPDSIGHHAEWLLACKTGSPTTSNFNYAAALTEAALLGNVAFRVGKKIEWDAQTLSARNCPEADEFIQHHYRNGWKI